MPGVRDVMQPVDPRDRVDVVLDVVGHPKFVVGSHQQQFGLRQFAAVAVRVDHLDDGAPLFRRDRLQDAQVAVILDLFAVSAVRFQLVTDAFGHVQDVDHHRRGCRHAAILRCGEPGRPAPFRRSGHDESFHFALQPLCAEFRHGVHCPHGAFGHREQQRPGVVAVLLETVQRIRDQRVLLQAVVQRLVRNLPQDGCDGAVVLRYFSHRREQAFLYASVPVRLSVLDRAAGNHQQRAGMRDPIRYDDRKLVRPGDVLPFLRSQQQVVDGRIAVAHRFPDFPTVG